MGGTGVLHPTYGWPWIRIETTMVTTGDPPCHGWTPRCLPPHKQPRSSSCTLVRHPSFRDWAASTHCPHCPWRIPVSMEMAYVVGLWWDHEDKKRDAGQSILSIPVSLRYSLSHPSNTFNVWSLSTNYSGKYFFCSSLSHWECVSVYLQKNMMGPSGHCLGMDSSFVISVSGIPVIHWMSSIMSIG